MFRTLSLFFAFLLLTHTAFSEISDADYQKHASELKTKLKDREFTVMTARPFIVVGDESPERVALWATEVVSGTVVRLKQDYFAKDPDQILEIWLLKDNDSYRKHAKEFFNDEPDTPYGYYSSSHKALIMNISTGGGTLVHEIVHPFVEANFPNCPAWFNEGLGSLYEQSGTVDGHIYGYTNWRLRGLQDGLAKKVVPSFATLTSMSDREFYNEDTGTNYAEARYLLYYLQEKGLLRKYYKEFLAHAKTDPTGYKTLQSVLAVRDMAAFQKRWESFVLSLTF
ncbi:MAG: hypothetical protein JO053_13035 [Acidobacteria bacterium]|nr:hypothetical protein [Acidobacteriota bacterium]